MPTNFKSYEAQSRLLAAVIASQPGLKLNFKAIAQHFGSDTTASAIEHRFRPIRKHVAALRQAVAEGKDALDLAPLITKNEKDVQKYYGESTPQGIEFQFRAIKKDAKALKDAVDRGESPLGVATTATPRKRKAPTGASDNGRAGSSTPGGRKRTATPKQPVNLTNDEEDGSDVDYDLLDVTPTNTPTKRRATTTMTTAASAASSAGTVSGSATPTPSYALSSWAAVLQPTTPAPAVYHAPNATPALTIGATPSDQSHDDADHDVDDDDDVFIIDTPSKMPARKLPKLEFADGATDEDDKTWLLPPQPESASSFAIMSFSQSASFFDNDGAV